MNYFYHNILTMALSTPIGSSYVDLLPFIFCFVEKLHTGVLPRGIMAPVFPQHSSCTAYKASTRHFSTGVPTMLKLSFSFQVPLSYFNTNLIFFRHPFLVSSHVWWGMPPLSVCLRVPWYSLTEVLPLCGGSYVPDPLVDTVFHSHTVLWRGGQRPGCLLACPYAPVTPVVHCIGILL